MKIRKIPLIFNAENQIFDIFEEGVDNFGGSDDDLI
jgi:hypothetical protein